MYVTRAFTPLTRAHALRKNQGESMPRATRLGALPRIPIYLKRNSWRFTKRQPPNAQKIPLKMQTNANTFAGNTFTVPVSNTAETKPVVFEFGSTSHVGKNEKSAKKVVYRPWKLRSARKTFSAKNSSLQRDLDTANEEIARLRLELVQKEWDLTFAKKEISWIRRELEELADAKLREEILADKERAEKEIRSRSPKKIL